LSWTPDTGVLGGAASYSDEIPGVFV